MQKINLTLTTTEYQIVLDSLELMESKISAKIDKTAEPKKRRKLKEYRVTIEELLTDLAEDIDLVKN